MIVTVAAWTASSAALLAIALWVHTRVRGFLPEDAPRPGRKRHARPTPMAGVIPALLSIGCFAVTDAPWLAAAVATAALIGTVDDLKKQRGDGVRWTTKALALGVAAICVATDLVGVDGLATWRAAALVLGVFVVTNATNFLDNHDGVAAGLGTSALALVALRADVPAAATLAGIWLAFLPFNWPRARLFLGDGGALGLGVAIAACALRGARHGDDLDVVAALAPVLVFGIDFVQVVTARVALGYAPWIGDRRHVTHVMLGRGVPARWIAPVLVAAAWVFGLSIPP